LYATALQSWFLHRAADLRWTAGLLSTQSGSIGRLVGNFAITVFGGWAATTVALANEMYLAFAACVVLCLLLFAASYRRLQKAP
jgi:nitrate/nitrite transporter NarK